MKYNPLLFELYRNKKLFYIRHCVSYHLSKWYYNDQKGISTLKNFLIKIIWCVRLDR